MDFLKILGIALALAVDASVVAFSGGLVIRSRRLASSLELALVTGAFQAAMPLLGFWFTGKIHKYIAACDHWIAFGVFGTLGATIIFNAWRASGEKEKSVPGNAPATRRHFTPKKLLGIGIATSIDALAVGAGIACMQGNRANATFADAIGIPALAIGVVTFFCVLAAFHSTHFFKRFPARALETVAGLILVALGTATLIQHTCL